MKWLLFWFVSFAGFANTTLEPLSFQDDALAKCIKETAAEKQWHTVEQFTDLKCHGIAIKHAQELAQFVNLQSLSLYNNQLTDLDLTSLRKLTLLNLANNQLTQLQIHSLAKLEKLYLFKNSLTTLDMTGLSALHTVRMMQNKLTKLDISPLTQLKMGYFFDNQLTDLQITGLNELEFLDVRQNPMSDELYDFYDQQAGVVISHDGNADDWK